MRDRLVPPAWRKAEAVLWFPVLFAVALPLAFLVAFRQPRPHDVTVAVVGNEQAEASLRADLRADDVGGLSVRGFPTTASATAAVRDRRVDAAYEPGRPTSTLYVARADSLTRASYLQRVFGRLATEQGEAPPAVVDLVPPAPGDGGTGMFFFAFPMMMAGLITAIALLQAPTWTIAQRVVSVAGVGAVATVSTYLAAVLLDIVPNKPLLLLPQFVLSQVYGQLLAAAALIVKRYFLPVAMTFGMILSVPSSGGVVTRDMLPAGFRFLNGTLPLAQGIKVNRSVAYFDNADLTRPVVVLLLWVAIAAGTVAVAAAQQRKTLGEASRPAVLESAA